MRVRLLAAAGGGLLFTSLLPGCGLAFGHEDVEVPNGAPGTESARDDAVIPDHNVSDDDTLIVVDDGAEIDEDCGGREVVVTADDAAVVLHGGCGLVRASGRGSTVDVGSADKIVLIGVDNIVSFASGDPEVVNHGRNTTVTEGGVARK
ncbi:hypothetical protein A6A08_23685 [Nocardiopsis sp. TSRI0078]|uniref:DUF3060 domain-containing protein n=1 Tax=unclassified Nocardiopsis TaxID=2649073 RepID=UPI00093B5895|nr:DUF3060 domain-containing protein [Nocardiopsis sp. TSRI0078]OKI20217.1 hypothetical protein A6A08_23685 [Nocardiopsis sp. TSRI0078]